MGGGNSRQFPAEPAWPVPPDSVHLDQLKRNGERSLRAIRASGIAALELFNSSPPRPPPVCHAEVPELPPYSSVLCMRGFSVLVVGWRELLVAAGAGHRSGDHCETAQEETNRPESSAFTTSASHIESGHRLSRFSLGTRPPGPDRLPQPAGSRTGQGGDDLKKSRLLSMYRSGNLFRYPGAV